METTYTEYVKRFITNTFNTKLFRSPTEGELTYITKRVSYYLTDAEVLVYLIDYMIRDSNGEDLSTY